jgi:Na+-driven multidrug efflux pump
MDGRHGIHLSWKSLKPDPIYIKRAFFLGLPGSVELSMRALGPMAMSFLATTFGTLTMASYGVGTNILQVVTIPAMGLSMAVSTLVGQNIGAGNIQRAARVTVLGTVSGFILLTVVGAISYFFSSEIVAFFVPHDAGVIQEGARFIRIMCLAWGCIGIQLSIVSAFRASGKMITAMAIAIVGQLLFQFPLAYLLSKHSDLQSLGLWWSFPIANIAIAIVSIAWFAGGGWKDGRLTEDDKQKAHVTDETIREEGRI